MHGFPAGDDGGIRSAPEQTGTPREVFQHRELLESIGLGIPQAAELTQRLIAEGYPLPADLYTPAEVAEALLKLPRKEERAC